MRARRIRVLNLVAVLCLLLASCSGDFAAIDEPSVDTLQSAIRAVGYPCAGVVSSMDITNERTGWRVECQGAIAYTAARSSHGTICVTPMPFVDGVVPPGLPNRPQNGIDERCVSPGDI